MSCLAAVDCVGPPACCAMWWAVFQSVRVLFTGYSGQVLNWSQVPCSMLVQMHLEYYRGIGMERRMYHLWCRMRSGSC